MRIDDGGIKMKVQPENTPIRMKVSESGGSGTMDYLDLYNKPSLNGKELIGNVNEEDPTVPSWAKTEAKPVYTPEEVGALPEDAEMSFADVKALWDSVFRS